MATPSYWVFRRGQKWHSGWRDERGTCHSKVQPLGVSKDVAREFARKRAREAAYMHAGLAVPGKGIQEALQEFLARQDVKACTHALNERHLRDVINEFHLSRADQIT